MRLFETFYWVPDSPSGDACGGRNSRLKLPSRVARISPTLDHPRSASHSARTTSGPAALRAHALGESNGAGFVAVRLPWRPQSAFEVALQGSQDFTYPRPHAQRGPQRVHHIRVWFAMCAVVGRVQRARSRLGARAVAAVICV